MNALLRRLFLPFQWRFAISWCRSLLLEVLCHDKQLTRYPRVSHGLLVVFSRDSRAIARTQQQPRGARAQIHVTSHEHFLCWFPFLSWLLPVVSLQLEASTRGAERPSLASRNRAILVPHIGTALSGSSFFLSACRTDA